MAGLYWLREPWDRSGSLREMLGGLIRWSGCGGAEMLGAMNVKILVGLFLNYVNYDFLD